MLARAILLLGGLCIASAQPGLLGWDLPHNVQAREDERAAELQAQPGCPAKPNLNTWAWTKWDQEGLKLAGHINDFCMACDRAFARQTAAAMSLTGELEIGFTGANRRKNSKPLRRPQFSTLQYIHLSQVSAVNVHKETLPLFLGQFATHALSRGKQVTIIRGANLRSKCAEVVKLVETLKQLSKDRCQPPLHSRVWRAITWLFSRRRPDEEVPRDWSHLSTMAGVVWDRILDMDEIV
jgi:hypothetical protein